MNERMKIDYRRMKFQFDGLYNIHDSRNTVNSSYNKLQNPKDLVNCSLYPKNVIS